MILCQFLHGNNDNAEAKTRAIPQVFSENSQAKGVGLKPVFLLLAKCFKMNFSTLKLKLCIVWCEDD